MNLPNKLTVLRVIMVPFFMAAALINAVPYHYFIALIIFALASITDSLDGHIARKNNLITNFGKFLDPLADKILVMAALICLVDGNIISSVPVIIILAREFMVSGLRLVTAGDGIVVAAGIWGKLKTAFTMIAIILIYFGLGLFSESGILYNWLNTSGQGLGTYINMTYQILIWIAALLTLISGIQYLWAYKEHINPQK